MTRKRAFADEHTLTEAGDLHVELLSFLELELVRIFDSALYSMIIKGVDLRLVLIASL